MSSTLISVAQLVPPKGRKKKKKTKRRERGKSRSEVEEFSFLIQIISSRSSVPMGQSLKVIMLYIAQVWGT